MTTMGCQTLVIVRLTRSDGITGIGEATTIGGLSYGVESPEAIACAITDYLTPLLKGQPADNLNAITARMNAAIKGIRSPNLRLKPHCLMLRVKHWDYLFRHFLAVACQQPCLSSGPWRVVTQQKILLKVRICWSRGVTRLLNSKLVRGSCRLISGIPEQLLRHWEIAPVFASMLTRRGMPPQQPKDVVSWRLWAWI